MKMQPNAIVLGGTNPHKALIENLKSRGYYTILIDYYDNPPAKSAADKHIQESTLDKEKVLEIAKSVNAKLVISACVDQANVTACFVGKKLGLPLPYSYETAINVTNKGFMKRMMLENEIPTANYITTDRVEEYESSGLIFPIVVKPEDSNGSKGVRKANNYSELREYFLEAIEISRSKKAIIEEFKVGATIDAVCFVCKGFAQIIMTRQRFPVNENLNTVMQHHRSIIPANISKKAKDIIQKAANNISTVFELNNTALLIQMKVKDNDVNIIEFAPRVGGGLSYRTVPLSTGFDILNATIDSYLGITNDLYYKYPEYYYSENNIYAEAGVFDHVKGYRDLLKNDLIEEFYLYKTRGMKIGSDLSSRNRIGAFIVKSKSESELFKKIETAIDRLEVYNNMGKPFMRKDLYSIE